MATACWHSRQSSDNRHLASPTLAAEGTAGCGRSDSQRRLGGRETNCQPETIIGLVGTKFA